MDARDGIEPSITLLQRVVLPFDHPAIVRALSLLGTMHPLASVPTDYCAGLFRIVHAVNTFQDVQTRKATTEATANPPEPRKNTLTTNAVPQTSRGESQSIILN